jgi:alkanesulfonate monooxygenase SsuD/methylene tetrahydromethanopterin reductase-like flavin-dependent oxidoreductase (luciferase family)
VVRAMWSGARRGLRFEGRHYQLGGVHPGPLPRTRSRCGSARTGRARWHSPGRLADGWVSPLMSYKPPADAGRANLAIDGAARQAGRDPREIRRIYNLQGAFTSRTPAPASDSDQAVVGPPEHWVEVLTHLAADLGFGTFVLAAEPDPAALTTLIEDVAPHVRERVAERRASSPTAVPPEQGR